MIDKTQRKKRTNKWVFADLSRNISQQVWEIGESYRKSFREGKKGHVNSHPIQLLRYWYFLYLTGRRLMEPLIEPYPKITIINRTNETWVEVQIVNEKHFSKSVALNPDEPVLPGRRRRKNLELSEREVVDQVFPIFNEWEQKMWNFITEGGSSTDAEEVFRFQEWKSLKKENLNCLIKTNFRTNLRDENGKVHKECGITPHILRHMRAFNLVVNYGAEIPWVIRVFGWTDQRMLYYYAHIRSRLNTASQLDMLRRSRMLTNLTIDLAKAIPA